MSAVAFTVLGRPQPAGSKRAFPHRTTGKIVVVDAAKRSRPWKQQVAFTALEHRPAGRMLEGPLRLDVTFILGRPKSHLGRRGLLPSAPAHPAVRPDVDKLSRAVLDALAGVLYFDDAQIVVKCARKVYGDPERVEIRVAELGPAPAAPDPAKPQLPLGVLAEAA